MQIAAKKTSLDKCPHVSAESKGKLDSASKPPINLVTIGSGENALKIGNETVMYRHEETFYHPTGLGFLVEDTLSDADMDARIEAIDKLRFERVGQKIEVDLIALKNTSNDSAKFAAAAKKISSKTMLGLVLVGDTPDAMKAAVDAVKDKKPLIHKATKDNIDQMLPIAKDASLPITLSAGSLDELAALAEKAGYEDVVLEPCCENLQKTLEATTFIRRMALKKTFRPFGHPTIYFTRSKEPFEEAAEAASMIAKYAGIVILNNIDNWEVMSLLTVRQNIYTDPQKPLQVEAKAYEIGHVAGDSPVLVTTNFSLTYYSVESEVESSKVPSYIVSVDSEGMSVLTAWAAEKFTPEKIASALSGAGLEGKLQHKELILPGYVAVLSGKLQEESGWAVRVGPKEASGIPSYLKSLKK
jgi:acetyl-CoA decarbonylase/synthase complex subunit gamma